MVSYLFHYYMSKRVEREDVHIIPLGYEFDRAVRPFDERHVDRVHLITMDEIEKYSSPNELSLTKKQRHYDDLVIKYIESRGIEVVVHRIDMFEILPVMALISQIVKDEKQQNNCVSVNMSACGRLTSFAVTQAAMANQVRLYYVRADAYSQNEKEVELHGLSICNSCRIWDLENFRYDLPSGLDRTVLLKVSGKPDGLSGENLLHEIINEERKGYETKFWELPIRERRRVQSNYLTKLRKGPIERLEKAGYITKKRVGRSLMLYITPSGKYVACVCNE